jgi:hypothetical protein
MTLGQVLYALRKLRTVEVGFDSVLKGVLQSRNCFVHEFSIKYDLSELEK